MSRRLKQAAVVLVVLFAAAQLVRPERANPAITLLHPATKLSAKDIETICAEARK
jgi:hypothetical protein